MDDRSFDVFTRRLATGTTRRSVLRGALAAGAAALFARSRAQAAPPAKVDICHYDAEYDVYELISVSEKSWPAHESHGDFYFGDCCNTDECLPPESECQYAVCEDGSCTTYDVEDGTECSTGTCHDGVCGCPDGTVLVGDACMLENGQACIRTDPNDNSTGNCAGGRCNQNGVCIGCVNDQQCANLVGTGYTCDGDIVTPGICVAPDPV